MTTIANDSLQIRAATPEDGEIVAELYSASYPVLMPAAYERKVLDAALPLMTRANPKLLACGTYFLAFDGIGTLVGGGGWTPDRPGTGEREDGTGHVRHFATHPEHTGKGIGRTIFERCAASAQGNGIGRFECYASLNAQPFYAALGFRFLDVFDIPMAPGVVFPSARMEREV